MKTIIGLAFIAFIGIGGWQLFNLYPLGGGGRNVGDESMLVHGIRHLDPNYVCPMHPSVVSDHPGNCPICGMDLVSKTTAVASDSGVIISSAMQRNLGITTTKVGYGPVAKEVYSSGIVSRLTQARSTELSSTVEGKIHQIRYKVGDWVREGAVLFLIDSPKYTELRDALVEARDDRRFKEMNKYLNQLVSMGADRAVLLGVSILGPPPVYFEMIAPHSGKITKINVDVSSVVEKGTPLIHIDTPKLSEGEFRSFSRLARYIKEGSKAYIELPLLPGRTWIGRVIEVRHNDVSYFSTATISFETPDGDASQGMFASALIEAGKQDDVLRVPASAVIFGARGARVIRKHEDGHFIVLDVEVGIESENWIEIISGLREGGRVVTRGQFLIDSEANIRAGLARLGEGDD